MAALGCRLCDAAFPHQVRRFRQRVCASERVLCVASGSSDRRQRQLRPTAASSETEPALDRRHVLLAAAIAAWPYSASSARAADAVAAAATPSVHELEAAASRAYASRDFASAVQLLNEIVRREPAEARWREMRAQALVDGKNFGAALEDFDASLRLTPSSSAVDRARLLAGRGLAWEGLARWEEALKDYEEATALATGEGGQLEDPYVLNSMGNCHASLGEWSAARDAYLRAADGFQRASGLRGLGHRLDGAVYSASNAALMLAQLGDEAAATKEMERVARRAPGSVDMRAALAALYWRQGSEGAAEAEWHYACTSISAGCSRYQDIDWLTTVRRWPPVMVNYLQSFLRLRSSAATAGEQQAAAAGQAQRASFRE